MSKKVVISGDDFGFSEAFSIGSLIALTRGVVSDLALMVNLPSSPFAVRLLKDHVPDAPVSLHFNVVAGSPIAPASSIPSLVDADGRFFRSSEWRGDDPHDEKCRGTVQPDADDISRELLAQLERFHELTGRYPSHIDCHSVMTKTVRTGMRRITEELAIHCEGSADVAGVESRSCAECMPAGGNDVRLAMTARGCSVEDWESDAFGIDACPYDIAIIHFHPGFIDQVLLDNTSLTLPRCRDHKTLTDPRLPEVLAAHGWEAVSYEAVYKAGFQEPSSAAVARLRREFGLA